MIKIKLILFGLLLYIGVFSYQNHLLNQNRLYIKAQEKKIEELKKKILSLKKQTQVECFEKEIYNRKRFIEESSDEENNSFDEFNNTIIF